MKLYLSGHQVLPSTPLAPAICTEPQTNQKSFAFTILSAWNAFPSIINRYWIFPFSTSFRSMLVVDRMFVALQNSHVEILTPNMIWITINCGKF